MHLCVGARQVYRMAFDPALVPPLPGAPRGLPMVTVEAPPEVAEGTGADGSGADATATATVAVEASRCQVGLARQAPRATSVNRARCHRLMCLACAQSKRSPRTIVAVGGNE